MRYRAIQAMPQMTNRRTRQQENYNRLKSFSRAFYHALKPNGYDFVTEPSGEARGLDKFFSRVLEQCMLPMTDFRSSQNHTDIAQGMPRWPHTATAPVTMGAEN